MSWVAALQDDQGTPEQDIIMSQLAMMYLHVVDFLVPTVERIIAEQAMQDRSYIQLQMSLNKAYSKSIIVT